MGNELSAQRKSGTLHRPGRRAGSLRALSPRVLSRGRKLEAGYPSPFIASHCRGPFDGRGSREICFATECLPLLRCSAGHRPDRTEERDAASQGEPSKKPEPRPFEANTRTTAIL